MQPAAKALSIIGGDFSCVCGDKDRACLHPLSYSVATGQQEEKHTQDVLIQSFHLHEFRHEEYTHEAAGRDRDVIRSRLDRVYSIDILVQVSATL